MPQVETKLTEVKSDNKTNVYLAIVGLLAVIVTPVTSPQTAESVGNLLNPILGLILELLTGIINGLTQFEMVLFEQVNLVWAMPMVFVLVALIKDKPLFKDQPVERIRGWTAFVIFGSYILAQQIGFGIQFENMIPNLAAIIAAITGISLSELGSSAIHNYFVNKNVSLAYDRGAKEAQKKAA